LAAKESAETSEGARSESGEFLTLAAPGSAEIKVQRSRFLALSTPVDDEAAGRAAVAEMARRHHDCRHVCYAWRLGVGPTRREVRNDAGEPTGTAGEPILGVLRRADLTDCIVVVARYFGGVKLGTGGLARAYAAAAEAALEGAPRRWVVPGRTFTLRFAYALQRTLEHLLQSHGGRCTEAEYGVEIDWTIWLPSSRCAAFARSLRESTAGAVSLPGYEKP